MTTREYRTVPADLALRDVVNHMHELGFPLDRFEAGVRYMATLLVGNPEFAGVFAGGERFRGPSRRVIEHLRAAANGRASGNRTEDDAM